MNITLDRNDEQLTGLLTVHLTEADYAATVDAQIKDYTKRAQVKGFRPGKVPVGMVKKMYGKGILADEINKTLGKAVDGYVKEQNLRLLGEALPVASDVDFDTAKEFAFQFELGLLPEVELPADGTVEVERHQVSLDDDTIQQTNEQIARQYGETTNPDASEANDYLFGKLKKADEEGEGRTVLLPINKVKNGAEQFIGVKAGDVLTFDLKNAFDNDAAAIAGFSGLNKAETEAASGDYVLNVEKINRTAAPEMNQELFDKVFGPEAVSSQEEFDAKVRETMQQNYDRESDGALNNAIVEKLVTGLDIKLPAEFFKKWLVRANAGKLTAEQVEEHYSDYEKELKWSLIRNKVVEKADLKVSNDEIVNRTLDKIMGQFSMPNMPDDMRESMRGYADSYLKQDNGKQYVAEYEAILAEKVLENLRGKVVVTDKPVTAEEFRNLHS
ncbi:trigger factor [Hymenobacter sp. PAMC 26628]|uniref:trigger factor n=1 Tax=Hymenobacter sp. PAMC 26628 TaxID=1484118 RepID=UPI000770646A|nr:trigger factor [Hymenobacter sp. PAMC 26628]AMJ66582.1 trigger factor [Hymenobacter sp. PAMC 26628]